MKNKVSQRFLPFISILLLINTSCNKIAKNVENAFLAISIKTDSINTLEEAHVEKLFHEINSKRIRKYDGENSALIYYSCIRYNHFMDSLIVELMRTKENVINRKQIIQKFKKENKDLSIKYNLIKEFKTQTLLDSMLSPTQDFELMPLVGLRAEFENRKLNGTKSAFILLKKIQEKTAAKAY